MSYQPDELLLDTYCIEELIDDGSFGEVYRVTHLGLKVERAIKVLKRGAPGVGSTAFSDCQQRFEMEAQLGARLNTPTPHPNLLQVHNFQQVDDLLVLEMEYAPGGSLADRIAQFRKTKQPIPIEEVIQIGIDVASGLAELHELDIVHRDLKPSNILFDNKGRAKVADLGLAQIPGGPSMRTNLSEPPLHPGTSGYMSPEQKNSREYLNSASDVYTLGLVLFEVLTSRMCANKPAGTRARSLRPDTPRWLDDLIVRMLSGNPQERPWDGAEVAKQLKQGNQDIICLNRFPRWICLLILVILMLGLFFGMTKIVGRETTLMPTEVVVAVLDAIDTRNSIITKTYSPSATTTVTITPTTTSTHSPTIEDTFSSTETISSSKTVAIASTKTIKTSRTLTSTVTETMIPSPTESIYELETVPDVIGMRYDEAEKFLGTKNLKPLVVWVLLGDLAEEVTAKFEKGSVIDQQPNAGEVVDDSGEIVLWALGSFVSVLGESGTYIYSFEMNAGKEYHISVSSSCHYPPPWNILYYSHYQLYNENGETVLYKYTDYDDPSDGGGENVFSPNQSGIFQLEASVLSRSCSFKLHVISD